MLVLYLINIAINIYIYTWFRLPCNFADMAQLGAYALQGYYHVFTRILEDAVY